MDQNITVREYSQQNLGERIASIAATYEGVNYVYGGSDPSGFDCSGLVQYVHKIAGISVPRTTDQQYAVAKETDLRNPKIGDTVFFATRSSVNHVGILVDEDAFIHAPKSGESVKYQSLDDPYWRERLLLIAPLYRQ